jgi:hypothetical protein
MVAGPATRLCSKSKPPTAVLIRTDTPCPGVGSGCFVHQLRAAGFASRSKVILEIVSVLEDGVTRPCPLADCTKDIKMDADGRAFVAKALGAYSDTVVTVDVGGVRASTPGG